MCEFCTEHGEGRKWYLEMKNYAGVLLHEQLTAEQQKVVGTGTRLEWGRLFYQYFVMPALTGIAPALPGSSPPQSPPTVEQIVAANKVEHFGQVLPIEDVEKVIDLVDSITRMPCGCRFRYTGLTDQRYCFGVGMDKLGVLGTYPEPGAALEVLDKEEAKRLFRRYDEEGLMHSVWTGVTPYVVGLCNCDGDCGAYRGYIQKRGPQSFFRAEYLCQVDHDLCNGCRSCLAQCQFGSMVYSSSREKVSINPQLCFGCGVCRAACPAEAISLVPRKTSVAAEIW